MSKEESDFIIEQRNKVLKRQREEILSLIKEVESLKRQEKNLQSELSLVVMNIERLESREKVKSTEETVEDLKKLVVSLISNQKEIISSLDNLNQLVSYKDYYFSKITMEGYDE